MGEREYAPEWLEFEAQLGYRPQLHSPLSRTLEEWGSLLNDLSARFSLPQADTTSIRSVDMEIAPEKIPIRIYFPEDTHVQRNVPLAVYVHGGGWAMGDLDSEDFQPRTIAKEARMVVVSVDYRLAPGHPFPDGLNDCVRAISWTSSNSTKLGATTQEVIVIGGSAGANLAIASALKIIDQGQKSILKGVAALVPVTVHPDAVPLKFRNRYRSYDEEADCPIDTADAMRGRGGFWDAYTNEISSHTSVLLHPRLHEMPPTYIAVAEKDVLRDDGLLLKHVLEEYGVPVKCDSYRGLPHYFWSFPGPSLANKAREFQENLLKGLEFVNV
ncbi:hypothetical protein AYO21_08671 [Fonsecaea monophora]|uniref:Alpha/beta hydrolase fold-3 domain-containing protein n=1 Tax=Fonsecaea monophora TaxID=254056 RepID=A0A177EZX2_9EURO|nr:hypothetical protein AYO21_08671 [Fonsecaea monophora]OAG37136.1 hypothetical protein AYO21_08671 [Fonsecaea monophora]